MAAYRWVRFMTHVTCRLTAKNRNQLRNPSLGNRVWASFTFYVSVIGRYALTPFAQFSVVMPNYLYISSSCKRTKNGAIITHKLSVMSCTSHFLAIYRNSTTHIGQLAEHVRNFNTQTLLLALFCSFNYFVQLTIKVH